jgi:hypothetical protein
MNKRDDTHASQPQSPHKGDIDMNHPHRSISNSLVIHGIQGIDTHHKTAKLMADVNSHRIISELRNANAMPGIRHRIGGMMIALGAAIAGKTHDIQARQATMPSPSSAKPGVVPTR